MADLIDRGEAILSLYGIEVNAEGTIPFRAAVFAIRHTPSAEQTSAERRGKWIERNPLESEVCRLIGCSECDKSYIVPFNVPYEDWTKAHKYCVECGARMEE